MGYGDAMRLLVTMFCMVVAATAYARPVSYADSWALSTWNDGMENSFSANYSPTARDAIGLRSDYLREEEAWMHAVNYNRVLTRWNMPDAQANLYFLGGAGVAMQGDDQGAVAWGGIAADWENRRYYVSYENRVIASSVIEQAWMQKARVGVAPYITGYDGVHTWLMLQVTHQPRAEDPIVLTPLVRVFTSEVLGEVGIGTNGDMMFNITTQF